MHEWDDRTIATVRQLLAEARAAHDRDAAEMQRQVQQAQRGR